MQILIESTLDCRNMGDLAMLQVALRRLRGIWPRARLLAMASDPEGLRAHCPEVDPVFVLPGDPFSGLSRGTLWSRLEALYRRWLPGAPSGDLGRRDRRRLSDHFLKTLRSTDLYVIAGMGSFTSAFEPDVFRVLEMIPVMKSMGVPCVAFSQGIGPIERRSATWALASRTLPMLDFIALREGRFGPPLLRELGVPGDRVALTGDDAIEVAFREDPPAVSNKLGVCLRVAAYSSVTDADALQMGVTLRAAARKLGAELAAAPVSHLDEQSDLDTFAVMFPEEPKPALPAGFRPTPEWVAGQVSQCRLLVCGAYHAAVFALSQGIPAVCIAESEYYRNKFLGLAAQFGDGCQVLSWQGRKFPGDLAETIERMWNNSFNYRSSLLNAATQQIQKSKDAWNELRWRLPNLSDRESAPERAGDSADLVNAWYRHRTWSLSSELQKCVAYLKELEAARDWYRERAERFESELQRAQKDPRAWLPRFFEHATKRDKGNSAGPEGSSPAPR